jgi:hypothetical protein
VSIFAVDRRPGSFTLIVIGQLLAAAVLHDEGSTDILDGPGRREGGESGA